MENLLKEAWWRGYKKGLGAISRKVHRVNEEFMSEYMKNLIAKRITELFVKVLQFSFKKFRNKIEEIERPKYLANKLLPGIDNTTLFNKFYEEYLDETPNTLYVDIDNPKDLSIVEKAAQDAVEINFKNMQMKKKMPDDSARNAFAFSLEKNLVEDFVTYMSDIPERKPEDYPELELGVKKPGRPKGTGVKKNVWTVHR